MPRKRPEGLPHDPERLPRARAAGRASDLVQKAKKAIQHKVPLPGTAAFDDLEAGLLDRDPTWGEMIPCELLLQYRKAGLSTAQMAQLLEVKPRAIKEAMEYHHLDMRSLKAWKEHRADVLAHKQSLCAAAITPDKIATASLRDLGHTLSILHTSERLERGQATQNVDVRVLMGELDELQKLEEKLVAEIKRLGGADLAAKAEDAELVDGKDGG